MTTSDLWAKSAKQPDRLFSRILGSPTPDASYSSLASEVKACMLFYQLKLTRQ